MVSETINRQILRSFHEGHDQLGLRRLRTQELYDQEKQTKDDRQTANEKVLPFLPQTYSA